MNSNGDAAVVWFGYGNGAKEVVRAATGPAGGAWSQPVALSDVNGYSSEPDIAIDPQGNATAVWTTGPQNQYGFVQTATHPAGGAGASPWRFPTKARPPQCLTSPPTREGNLTAIWDLGGEEGIVALEDPAGGQRMELRGGQRV